MFITITSIRLKNWWRFFELSYHGMKISREIRNCEGFIQMKNTGFGYLHFTMSAWESKEDLKKFYSAGAHLDAMKKTCAIAAETSTYTYYATELPNWKEAKSLLIEEGRMLKWN
jgi:hypothetical protein